MFFSPFVRGLENDDELRIKRVQVAARIHELLLDLVVFRFEQHNLEAQVHTGSFDGGGEQLRSCITYEGYLDGRKA